MVLFYVTQIKLHRFDGAFTIDNVPDRYKDAVMKKLTEEGFYEVESNAWLPEGYLLRPLPRCR